jgi:hypothetical protein
MSGKLFRATRTCMCRLQIGWLELVCYLASFDATFARTTRTCPIFRMVVGESTFLRFFGWFSGESTFDISSIFGTVFGMQRTLLWWHLRIDFSGKYHRLST